MVYKITFTPLNYTGWNSLSHLSAEVKRLQAKKILVVTDPTLIKIGLTTQAIQPLLDANYSIELYSEVAAEPSLALAEKLVAYTRQHKFDMIIGIGGGSALDLSKLAGVLAVHEGFVADYLNLTGTKKSYTKGFRLFSSQQRLVQALK